MRPQSAKTGIGAADAKISRRDGSFKCRTRKETGNG
jgi:hypothetical protein